MSEPLTCEQEKVMESVAHRARDFVSAWEEFGAAYPEGWAESLDTLDEGIARFGQLLAGEDPAADPYALNRALNRLGDAINQACRQKDGYLDDQFISAYQAGIELLEKHGLIVDKHFMEEKFPLPEIAC